MKTKRARRGRAFDRMPSGVVMTNDFSTAKVHTLFGTAKRFRLLFCRRSHFDNECHSECAFSAAFWPYSNGLSLNVLRGSPRLSPAKRLPSWTCLGRIRQKAPHFRWKVGGGGLFLFLDESRNGGNECNEETDTGEPRAVDPKR